MEVDLFLIYKHVGISNIKYPGVGRVRGPLHRAGQDKAV